MNDQLDILYLEDCPNDAELVRFALEAGELDCAICWVNNYAAFVTELESKNYDLILADYSLPDCDGYKTLAVAGEKAPQTPFILVTGALGDELAIDMIKAGAADYVLKTNLLRLQSAVPKALETAKAAWEKSQALAELQLSEERFELAVKGSGAGLWDWADVNQEQMWWSPRIYELLGFTPDELPPTSRNFFAQLHPEDVAGAKLAMQRHFTSKVPYDAQFRIYNKQGELIWLRSRGRALWDDDGKATRMAGYIQDITDRKLAEKRQRDLERQLLQAQKMEAIGTLAGGIAHDFNNILASILGYAGMLERQLPEGSRQYRDLQQVLKAADRAKQLVRQILTFSRKSAQEKTLVQVDLIVKEVLTMLRATLPTTIEIKQIIEPNKEVILADATHIHQLLMNLCTNAFHAMPQGGVLRVSLQKTDLVDGNQWHLPAGPYLQLQISDTGTGIEPAILERIFDPYFTTKDVDVGTGLGLSVARGIIEELQGRITVATQMDKGTTFTILFPCQQFVAEELQVADKVTDLRGSEHILLVDDETSLVSLWTDYLESFGYRVTGQTSSLAALAQVQADPAQFDLLITDLTMPRLTGVELAKKIKPIAPELPIILCTGLQLSLESEDVAEAGICQVLLKTDMFDKLPTVVRSIFANGGDA